jgi:hypothetical protein
VVLKKALNHPGRVRPPTAGEDASQSQNSADEYAKTGLPVPGQARGPGFESPMLHPRLTELEISSQC